MNPHPYRLIWKHWIRRHQPSYCQRMIDFGRKTHRNETHSIEVPWNQSQKVIGFVGVVWCGYQSFLPGMGGVYLESCFHGLKIPIWASGLPCEIVRWTKKRWQLSGRYVFYRQKKHVMRSHGSETQTTTRDAKKNLQIMGWTTKLKWCRISSINSRIFFV